MSTHDKVKRMVGALGLAIGIAYALHQGSVASAAVGFADEILMIGLAAFRRLF